MQSRAISRCATALALALSLAASSTARGGSPELVSVSGGEAHSVALDADGAVWCWGVDGAGQLGDGDPGGSSPVPARVVEPSDASGLLSDVEAIAVSMNYWLDLGGHTVALRADGTVWAWGNGWDGALGDGEQVLRSAAVQVLDPTHPSGALQGASAIGAGDTDSYAIVDGVVYGWGDNASGQLGEPVAGPVLTAAPIPGAPSAASAVTGGGGFTLALADGVVWAWGANNAGQLGDGTTITRAAPATVGPAEAPLGGITALAAGDAFSVALGADGRVWTWGANLDGQLGSGAFGVVGAGSRLLPGEVVAPDDPKQALHGIIAVAAGNQHALALDGDGVVWAWGRNSHGQLGDGGFEPRHTPAAVLGLPPIRALGAGSLHTLAVDTEGRVWAWGGDWAGQAGQASLEPQPSPVLVDFPAPPTPELLAVRGPGFVTPGDEATFVVVLTNTTGGALEDAVLALDVPEDLQLARASDGGVLRQATGQPRDVVWSLGDVAADATVRRSVRLAIPFGTSAHERGRVGARVGARNLPSYLDVDEVLGYAAAEETLREPLDGAALAALYAADPELAALRDHAEALGYHVAETGLRLQASDGSSALSVPLYSADWSAPGYLQRAGEQVFGEVLGEPGYRLFDTTGGVEISVDDGRADTWGGWATQASLAIGACVTNCMMLQVPGYIIKAKYKVVKAFFDSIDCVSCVKSGSLKSDACIQCSANLSGAPVIEQIVHTKQCYEICAKDPDHFKCTKDVKACDPDGFVASSYRKYLDMDVVYTRKCNTQLGIYVGSFANDGCASGERCYEATPGTARCIDKKLWKKLRCGGGASTKAKADAEEDACEGTEAEVGYQVLEAHDPNAKRVDVEGDVVPGERLGYTVEYENEGAGTAFDVFVIDALPAGLDPATLDIDDGGAWAPESGTVAWEIGEVPPGAGGEVGLHVDVDADAAEGLELVNYADVHFPSAGEVTPTNAVVSVVRALVAAPQRVDAEAGVPQPITLTGRHALGEPLDYTLVAEPLHGTLSGSPPDLHYTAAATFSGRDGLSFVVSDGARQSLPARVDIDVTPDPAEAVAPVVEGSWPEDGATGIRGGEAPATTTPITYPPLIWVELSEPIDEEALPEGALSLEAGAPVDALVAWDAAARRLILMPQEPLSEGTLYTARLSPEVRDLAGNALASEHVFHFTTRRAVEIAVRLPEPGMGLRFGDVEVGASDERVVAIASLGSAEVSVTALTLSGPDAEAFALTDEGCTSAPLPADGHCTARVAFAPARSGAHEARLEIASTDPIQPSLTVSIGAQGVAGGEEGESTSGCSQCATSEAPAGPDWALVALLALWLGLVWPRRQRRAVHDDLWSSRERSDRAAPVSSPRPRRARPRWRGARRRSRGRT